MYDIIGVVLDTTKKLYFFSPGNNEYEKGEKIIVETEYGFQIGTIKTEKKKEKKENLVLPLKSIRSRATEEDVKKQKENEKECLEILKQVKKIAKDSNLPMIFIEASYTLDKSRLFLGFVSEERVDFRELAKKLAQKYHTRIEFRQIGVRDKAKKIGGLGPCGLFLCCNSFLTEFNSVSINMAKNQFLALNPTKINGVCGRLLCCLNYENDVYTELKKELPAMGSIIKTKNGLGKVTSVNLFARTFNINTKEKGIVECNLEDLIK